MNYAHMIQEDKLKKGFIIATLVSTIIGSFTASMTLHDKYQEKKDKAKQKNLDQGQDKQIQDLRAEVKSLQSQPDRKRLRSRSRRRRSSFDDEEEDFDRSARRSRAMIEQKYEDYAGRMGSRFAQGDVITENKLQAQIIALQQSVIDVLQQALLEGRPLSRTDIHRLVTAQDSARQGSLDAMRDQYDRMLEDTRRRSLQLEYEPLRRQLTLPAPVDSPMEDYAPVRRVQTQPAPYRNGSTSSVSPIYCRYALDLQSDTRRPLHSAFSPTGSQRCPSCGVRVPVSTKDEWVLETRTPIQGSQQEDSHLVEVRTFTMDARLVVKSHTAEGQLACVLCYKERDVDCVCRSVDALVRHIGNVHSSAEFEREEDMVWER